MVLLECTMSMSSRLFARSLARFTDIGPAAAGCNYPWNIQASISGVTSVWSHSAHASYVLQRTPTDSNCVRWPIPPISPHSRPRFPGAQISASQSKISPLPYHSLSRASRAPRTAAQSCLSPSVWAGMSGNPPVPMLHLQRQRSFPRHPPMRVWAKSDPLTCQDRCEIRCAG